MQECPVIKHEPVLGAMTESLTRIWTDGLVGRTSLTSACVSGHTIQFSGSGAPRLKDHYDIQVTSEGSGSYGAVFPCLFRSSARPCVVKVVDKRTAGEHYSQDLVRRMSVLLQLTSTHQHPNIVQYVDMLESANFYFIIMERLQGQDLHDWFVSEFPLSESACRGVARQILSALQHLHGVLGMCHRDVKLENFRYRQQGSDLVLLDLDAALLLDCEGKQNISGTLGYLAPEVVRAIKEEQLAPAAAHADLWACGVVLYALLTGEPLLPSDANFELSTLRGSAFMIGRALNSKQLTGISENAKDLLKGLLDPEPQARLRARCALDHPWFQKVCLLTEPNTMLPVEAAWVKDSDDEHIAGHAIGKNSAPLMSPSVKPGLLLRSESWHW